MKRIDGGFTPFYSKPRFNENPRAGIKGELADQMIGSFQPLISIANDAQKTLKPYKSNHQMKSDFIQPFRGLGNIFLGLFSIVGSPFALVFNLLYFPYKIVRTGNFRHLSKLPMLFVSELSWIIHGFLNIARGSLQILTTPFTWFFRMPLRGFLTLAKGRPEFLENPQIERIVNNSDENQNEIVKYLGRRVDKAVKHGEKMPYNDKFTFQEEEFIGRNSEINTETLERRFNRRKRHDEKKINETNLFYQEEKELRDEVLNTPKAESYSKYIGLFKICSKDNNKKIEYSITKGKYVKVVLEGKSETQADTELMAERGEKEAISETTKRIFGLK